MKCPRSTSHLIHFFSAPACLPGLNNNSLVAQLVKNHLQGRRPGLDPRVGKIPWRRERLPTPVFWPGEFHGLQFMGRQSGTRLSDFHFYFPVLIVCTGCPRALISGVREFPQRQAFLLKGWPVGCRHQLLLWLLHSAFLHSALAAAFCISAV